MSECDEKQQPFDLRIISLGAGVQTAALYLMALEGIVEPRPDYAIFADTQREPPWVYETVEKLRVAGGDQIPIITGTVGDIGESIRRAAGIEPGRFVAVPFWVDSEDRRGAGRWQCTREFKIDVVRRTVRQLLGLKPRQRAAGKYLVEEWVGISLDEATRAKPSRYRWMRTRWPFLFDVPMRRYQIEEWLLKRGWNVRKSACIFCPYRSALEWARWREQEPELFREAVAWDEMIRNGGTMRGMHGHQYILDRLIPLSSLPSLEELQGANDAQLNLFENDCEGYCGL